MEYLKSKHAISGIVKIKACNEIINIAELKKQVLSFN